MIRWDLRKGINFADNSFNVVYHSQFIEHLPRETALDIMKECYRVLRPGGILRVVTPDLENMARNYLLWLEKSITNPTEVNIANYDWLTLELFDQTVRNSYGGEMAKVLSKEDLVNEQFIIERTGSSGRTIRRVFSGLETPPVYIQPKKNIKQITEAVFRRLCQLYLDVVIPKKEKQLLALGEFRMAGEIHYCMYDRFSLERLFKQAGFNKISLKTPYESDIPNWNTYELDVKDGDVIDPASIFMEARK